MRISFTDRELDVMAVLWERGSATVAEVRERLPDELAYTTVLTVLRTLEEEGHVEHRGEGKAHGYFRLVAAAGSPRASARRARVHDGPHGAADAGGEGPRRAPRRRKGSPVLPARRATRGWPQRPHSADRYGVQRFTGALAHAARDRTEPVGRAAETAPASDGRTPSRRRPMIVLWMAYSTVVAALVGGAALVVDRTTGSVLRQRRWIWAAALVLSLGIPLWGALRAPPAG